MQNQHQRTLLVIDDEPLMTDMLGQAMTKRLFHVLVASSGKDAMQMLDHLEGAVDLVLTDMTMPDMDGLAVAHELISRLPGVPVMITTGHDLDAKQMNLPPNVIEIVRKPYSTRTLAAHINDILDKRGIS